MASLSEDAESRWVWPPIRVAEMEANREWAATVVGMAERGGHRLGAIVTSQATIVGTIQPQGTVGVAVAVAVAAEVPGVREEARHGLLASVCFGSTFSINIERRVVVVFLQLSSFFFTM